MHNSKVSSVLSFYTIKDYSGSVQLMVTSGDDILQFMRNIPPESSVLVEGEVKPRPLSSRRSVRKLKF